jgi:hypothetical protein
MALTVLLLSFFYFLENRFNKFLIFSFLGFCVATGFFFYNYQTFGSVLPPYYMASRLSFDSFSEAFLGHLISPNRGLLVFFPLALMSIYGFFVALKNKQLKYRRLYLILFSGFLVYVFIYSLFPHWWMGYSYGPRMFAEIVPLLVILMVPVFNYWHLKWLKISLSVLILYSVAVQVVGAYSWKAVGDWNVLPISVDLKPERIWDWSDMQVLRTFKTIYPDLPLNYKASQLPTIIGSKNGEFLDSSSGTAGFLSFGPYVPLKKGKYVVFVNFVVDANIDNTKDSIGFVDVVYNQGKNIIIKKDIYHDDLSSGVLSIEFVLNEDVDDLEIRVFKNENRALTLKGIVISNGDKD